MMAAGGNGSDAGFGPKWLGPDTVRFRLWAPQQSEVSVVVDGRPHAMTKSARGWFSIEVTSVSGGTLYSFRLENGMTVPDPASHFQPEGLTGPSMLVEHGAYSWRSQRWTGYPWEETVASELHIGTFTPEGTFKAAELRLSHLASIGINAIEVLPVAQMPGERGWGYDGVLHYAPHHAYGTPDELKSFVDTAHSHGIAVYLDVVYNHFGPSGNFLPHYAPGFFDEERHTPWGASIRFECPPVRRYFIDNALHWLQLYRFDGLRFDATHQIYDASAAHVLAELVREVREKIADRSVHLIAEGHRHRPGMVGYRDGEPLLYDAGWNDPFHQALNVIVTGETGGYYADYADDPEAALAGAIAYEGARRPTEREVLGGEAFAQAYWPPQAFMNFLQNHDQVGNRAFGDRLWSRIDPSLARVLTALLLLTPQIPLLFMGDEYGEVAPFMFFADYEGELGEAVRKGRRSEAENFSSLAPGDDGRHLPDPLSPATFEASKLDWTRAASEEGHARAELHGQLIDLRRRYIVPLLAGAPPFDAAVLAAGNGVLAVDWAFPAGTLEVRVKLRQSAEPMLPVKGRMIWSEPDDSVSPMSHRIVVAVSATDPPP